MSFNRPGTPPRTPPGPSNPRPAYPPGPTFPWWIVVFGLIHFVRLLASNASAMSARQDLTAPILFVLLAAGFGFLLYRFAGPGRTPGPTPPPRRSPATPPRVRPSLWDDTVDGPFFR